MYRSTPPHYIIIPIHYTWNTLYGWMWNQDKSNEQQHNYSKGSPSFTNLPDSWDSNPLTLCILGGALYQLSYQSNSAGRGLNPQHLQRRMQDKSKPQTQCFDILSLSMCFVWVEAWVVHMTWMNSARSATPHTHNNTLMNNGCTARCTY